jgi:Tetracyclin repressor-like, C-terminal domain
MGQRAVSFLQALFSSARRKEIFTKGYPSLGGCASPVNGKGDPMHKIGLRACKEDLVLAVIERLTNEVLAGQQPLLDHLDSWENLEHWCEYLVAFQEKLQCVGGCPIGSLASELADQDEVARGTLVSSFDRWEGYVREGLTRMQERGELRTDADPGELAVAMMASLQGGFLLTQTRKTTQPLRIALHAAFTYVHSFGPPSTSFQLTGQVNHPGSVTLANLQTFPKTTVLTITQPLGTHRFSGTLLYSLLQQAGIKTNSTRKNDILRKAVLVTGTDGYIPRGNCTSSLSERSRYPIPTRMIGDIYCRYALLVLTQSG